MERTRPDTLRLPAGRQALGAGSGSLSGDSDFAPLLDAAKQQGKRVIVMSTKGHIAKELLERAKYVNLKKIKEKIIYE